MSVTRRKFLVSSFVFGLPAALASGGAEMIGAEGPLACGFCETTPHRDKTAEDCPNGRHCHLNCTLYRCLWCGAVAHEVCSLALECIREEHRLIAVATPGPHVFS
jgi:hypothetical protein